MRFFLHVIFLLFTVLPVKADLNNFCSIYSDLLTRIDQDQYELIAKKVLTMSEGQQKIAFKVRKLFADDFSIRKFMVYHFPDLADHLPPRNASVNDIIKTVFVLIDDTDQWNKFLLQIASENNRLSEIAELAAILSTPASKSDVLRLVEMAAVKPQKLDGYLQLARSMNVTDLNPVIASAIYKVSPVEQALAIARKYDFADIKSVESYVIQSTLKEVGVIPPKVEVAKEWPGILKYLQFYRMYQKYVESRRLLLIEKIEGKLNSLGVFDQTTADKLRSSGSRDLLAMAQEIEKEYKIDLPDEALRSIPGIEQFSSPLIQFSISAFDRDNFIRIFGHLEIKPGLTLLAFANDANKVQLTYPEILKVAWSYWEKNPEQLTQIKQIMLKERKARAKEINAIFGD